MNTVTQPLSEREKFLMQEAYTSGQVWGQYQTITEAVCYE